MIAIGAIVCFALFCIAMLAGCQGNNYEKANSLFEEGKYAEAAKIYAELGDHEDSAQKLQECNYLQAGALADSGDYEEALKLYQSLGEYEDAAQKAIEVEQAIARQTYAQVYDYIESEPIYFPGGDETALNKVVFSKGSAKIEQVLFDGNGVHENEGYEGNYTVDDKAITIAFEDGTDYEIPYAIEGQSVALGEGEYLLKAQIEDGLKGCWKISTSQSLLGSPLRNDYYLELKDGKFAHQDYAESAWSKIEHQDYAESAFDDNEYFYSIYDGSYTLGFGVFDMDSKLTNKTQWEWGIKDAKPVVLHYGKACEKIKALPSDPDSYKF